MKRFEVTRITTTVVEAKDEMAAIWTVNQRWYPPDTETIEAVELNPEPDDLPHEHFDDVMAERIAARNE